MLAGEVEGSMRVDEVFAGLELGGA
jgi:hypothetical protein